MSDFTDEYEVTQPKPQVLGVIGSRTDLTDEQIRNQLLTPILQELERYPEKVLLPAEGTSSIFIGDWADQLKIPNMSYQADWFVHGRRAKVYRDARIQEESTIFVIFLNKRSDYNQKLATRLAKKGNTVFTIDYKTLEIEQLIVEPSLSPPSEGPKERGRKRGTGKESKLRQEEPSKDLGSQSRLTSLWAT